MKRWFIVLLTLVSLAVMAGSAMAEGRPVWPIGLTSASAVER